MGHVLEAVTKIVSCRQQMPCDRPGQYPPYTVRCAGNPNPTASLHYSTGQLRIRHHFCLFPFGHGLKTRLKDERQLTLIHMEHEHDKPGKKSQPAKPDRREDGTLFVSMRGSKGFTVD